ncbi:hypothetical protein MJO28_009611 [Puccinia striiformis f. sp. tritici]|uniref:Retrotransposon gag domain-containing protein n=2 Tax=Puccinia striiformis f. sp. tritici TaxID=168172 RepID=A0A0L0V6X8_9BASI|nr:hypothetical protein Pst134EA_017528 [Puccinia striiformis f. sp. tritici]KAI9607295.1 hypothetical protein H4Q26_005812 [Puccinia striiformis f. sp. tritici PST-130]KNE95055.1 hypothetical protein PSTG_11648 [Puccinia striiformis f. sp. tritici PST-78]KAH9450917.1 hypothetical protein Pst134EB_018426 [Puccinia striiformis f. sp. tritici]KAH9461219.1 hypothetical protein Pst134EA_017528 [Puccinia striiformis f. sp. tritici]KAI7947703.1 hypothetical protein MJO28_009611 [Puccinia striiformis
MSEESTSDSVETEEYMERDLDVVFECWLYQRCPTYDGRKTTDVELWIENLLFLLDVLNAHPDIWHLAGIRLIEGRALEVLNESFETGNGPTDWHSFTQWVKSLNSLAPHVVNAYNKSVIADDYENLHQAEKESVQAFFERFNLWRLRADYHDYTFDSRSAFLDCLNVELRSRVCRLLTDMKRMDISIDFPIVLRAALHLEKSRSEVK